MAFTFTVSKQFGQLIENSSLPRKVCEVKHIKSPPICISA
ncbi:hypothetical protein J2S18_001082 [Eubacterium multiforme]|uniref:Cyclic lactone autoinducer peptide n=1 Tax=Eubacterium multiforme TaxID=83339 RepID=A0ABT9US61_9FIRM|nr:hypothetical protein [Eubacterium multiforme]